LRERRCKPVELRRRIALDACGWQVDDPVAALAILGPATKAFYGFASALSSKFAPNHSMKV
jgi:hypothetical protein